MYTDKEKKVFKYHDGTREVWGDPITIHRRLTAYLDGNPNAVIDVTQLGMPTVVDGVVTREPTPVDVQRASEANDRLLVAVRMAFEMPFDRTTGEGANEDECFLALDAFATFMEQKKTTGESTPTCAPPSAGVDLEQIR